MCGAVLVRGGRITKSVEHLLHRLKIHAKKCEGESQWVPYGAKLQIKETSKRFRSLSKGAPIDPETSMQISITSLTSFEEDEEDEDEEEEREEAEREEREELESEREEEEEERDGDGEGGADGEEEEEEEAANKAVTALVYMSRLVK